MTSKKHYVAIAREIAELLKTWKAAMRPSMRLRC
jgi:hypothetical protein